MDQTYDINGEFVSVNERLLIQKTKEIMDQDHKPPQSYPTSAIESLDYILLGYTNGNLSNFEASFDAKYNYEMYLFEAIKYITPALGNGSWINIKCNNSDWSGWYLFRFMNKKWYLLNSDGGRVSGTAPKEFSEY